MRQTVSVTSAIISGGSETTMLYLLFGAEIFTLIPSQAICIRDSLQLRVTWSQICFVWLGGYLSTVSSVCWETLATTVSPSEDNRVDSKTLESSLQNIIPRILGLKLPSVISSSILQLSTMSVFSWSTSSCLLFNNVLRFFDSFSKILEFWWHFCHSFFCYKNNKNYSLLSAYYVPSTMLDTLPTLSLLFIASLLNVSAITLTLKNTKPWRRD